MKTIGEKILIDFDDKEVWRTESGLFKARVEGSLYHSRPHWGTVAEESRYFKKGEMVWFHHHVTDQETVIRGVKYYLADYGQILAHGDIDDLKPLHGRVIAKQATRPPREVNGIQIESTEQDVPQTSEVLFSNTEGISKGDTITYRINSDYEIDFRDNVYYFIGDVNIFTVNDELFSTRVEIEPLDEVDEFIQTEGGIFVKKKEKVQKKKGKIVRANDPELNEGDVVIYDKRTGDRVGDYQYPKAQDVYCKIDFIEVQ